MKLFLFKTSCTLIFFGGLSLVSFNPTPSYSRSKKHDELLNFKKTTKVKSFVREPASAANITSLESGFQELEMGGDFRTGEETEEDVVYVKVTSGQ